MANSNTLLQSFEVIVDGTPIDVTKRDALLDAVVEQSSELPDACNLRFGVSLFQKHGEALLASSAFPEGAKLAIKVRDLASEATQIFEGEIVGVELDLTSIGPSTLTVRALHPAHRLMRGSRQLTFLDQTDGDIFCKVVAKAGLTAKDHTTGGTLYPHTIQDNLTDWEFLQVLGRRRGARVGCAPGKTVVFDGFGAQSTTVQAAWGEELLSFRPRTHGAGQVDSVEVRGWDPKTKKSVVGTANDLTLGVPKAGTTVNKGKSGLPVAQHVLTNQAVATQTEAVALAKSELRRLRGRFLQMEAVCTGNPKLQPGVDLKVSNAGERFSGTYPITSTAHIYSPSEGYTTQVFSNGRDAEGLLPSLGGGRADHARRAMADGGLVVGIVTNNEDPEGLGRVKVKYPSLDESQESFWCRTVSQMAGAGRGFFCLPEVNDEVLIGFEQGSPHLPYVLGQLWNGVDKPPVLVGGGGGGGEGPGKPAKDAEVKDGKTDRRGFVSRIGHRVDLSDKDGKGYVWIQTAGQNEIALSDADQGIWLRTTGGHWIMMSDKHKGVKVHSTSGHELFMDDAGKKIVLKDSAGDVITFDVAGGSISIKANKEINLSAPQINIKADAQLNAESPKTGVKGTATLELEGGAAATLKSGAKTEVQGGAIVVVQGALVKIN